MLAIPNQLFIRDQIKFREGQLVFSTEKFLTKNLLAEKILQSNISSNVMILVVMVKKNQFCQTELLNVNQGLRYEKTKEISKTIDS